MFVLLIIGCSPNSVDRRTESRKVVRVAITTLMSHPALDEVQAGFKEELLKLGYIEGKSIEFINRNASGQVQATTAIAKELAASPPDAVVAITTPMAQAIVNSKVRPVVFAAVTDPVGAKLVRNIDEGEEGVTGTSDAWPYEAQLRLIHEITPNVRTLGVLHNPGEAASQYGMKRIRALAPKLGFKLIEGPVDTPADVFRVSQNLADRVDALFLSSDNTVIGGAAGAIKVAIETKKPLYAGDSGTVEKGAMASVSVGYRTLGKETADLLDRVLKGETRIPTKVCWGDELFVNSKSASKMGVSIPPAVMQRARKDYGKQK